MALLHLLLLLFMNVALWTTAEGITVEPCQNISVVQLGRYPDYTGPLQVGGIVLVSSDMYQSIRIRAILTGLQPSVSGGIHIHTGTTCSNASLVGGHLHPGMTDDPWTNVTYQSNADGIAIVDFIYSYLSYDQVVGKALVIHQADANKTRIGCGVITLSTDGVGFAVVSGPMVAGQFILFGHNGVLEVFGALQGLPANATGTWEVGQGYDCTNQGTMKLGGPFKSSAAGTALIQFTVLVGVLPGLLQHAMVVYNDVHQKIACGIINGIPATSVPPSSPLPSPTPNCECNNAYRTPECLQEENAHAGSLAVNIPGCNFDVLVSLLAEKYDCTRATCGGDTLYCNKYVPEYEYTGLTNCQQYIKPVIDIAYP